MELSQVAKARKKASRAPQAHQPSMQQAAKAGMTADEMTGFNGMPENAKPPPRKPLSPRTKWGIGAGVLAAGGTGAYLYRRRRVEKSLSSMQRDWPYMMMRTT